MQELIMYAIYKVSFVVKQLCDVRFCPSMGGELARLEEAGTNLFLGELATDVLPADSADQAGVWIGTHSLFTNPLVFIVNLCIHISLVYSKSPLIVYSSPLPSNNCVLIRDVLW